MLTQFLQGLYNATLSNAARQAEGDSSYFLDLIDLEFDKLPGIILAAFNPIAEGSIDEYLFWKMAEYNFAEDFFRIGAWDRDCFLPFGREFYDRNKVYWTKFEDVNWELTEKILDQFFVFSGNYTIIQQPTGGCDVIYYVYEKYIYKGCTRIDHSSSVYTEEGVLEAVLS